MIFFVHLFLKNIKINFQAENFQLTWATAKIYDTSAKGSLPQMSVRGDVLSAHHSRSSARTFHTATQLTPGVVKELSFAF